jgi:putative oxidoreductase
MWRELFRTPNSASLAIVRLGLGLVMFAHGAQKMLAWFGGQGFGNTMSSFEQMGIPSVFAFLVIVAEFFGGLGLIVGFLSRVAAFGVLMTMAVAALKVHAGNGFFMNWTGSQHGEGFEYHILAMAMALAVIVGGAGAFSIDHAIVTTPVRRMRVA